MTYAITKERNLNLRWPWLKRRSIRNFPRESCRRIWNSTCSLSGRRLRNSFRSRRQSHRSSLYKLC